ncbi:MAG TPA: hypothetical protein VM093_02950 [Aeromicrobium sp.]|nr:hypothetical protein [Aeromicrobium sp.]
MTSKVLGPLSGVAFLVLVIGGALYGGEPPAEDSHVKSANDLAAAYAAQGDRLLTAVFAMGLGLVFFVFFASILKTTLDTGTSPTHCLSRAAFAGALIFTMGAATDLTLGVATVEAAKDKVDPVAIQALSAYFSNDWVPFAIGIVLLMAGSALSIINHGGLPVWLGWLAALIAIVAVIPPIGEFAFPAAGVWVLLASITMAVRAAKAPTAGPPAM